MNIETTPAPLPPTEPASRPAYPPRVWPALVAVAFYAAYQVISPWIEMATFVRFIARMGVALLLVLVFFGWWWTRRGIRWRDRGFGLLLAAGGAALAAPFVHFTLGAIGLVFFGLPTLICVWTLWMLVTARANVMVQRVGLAGIAAWVWTLVCLVRVDGLTGEQQSQLHWRWSPTAEEQFLAEKTSSDQNMSPTGASLQVRSGDWPGFRGPDRDGVVRGTRIATDWQAHPPRLVWRHRVGPAWSSMAVVAGLLFTQEQRGPDEAVVCYDALTGREVWAHTDSGRFEEQVSGAGPRATPTVADGKVYALGARGLLSCLDAATGRRLWSREIAAEAAAEVPRWGFASSPLVTGGLVIVFAGGHTERTMLAYRADSGDSAWGAPVGAASYGSPQLGVVAGQRQVLFFSDRGLTALDPATGAVLWQQDSEIPEAPRALQPHVVGPAQVLVAGEIKPGLQLVDVRHEGGKWTPTVRWESKAFVPTFDEFVVQEGYAYGWDNVLFACAELQTGKRRWKDGRYGHGQVLLLADQRLLLVTAEDGRVVLLRATPERHEELGRFRAIDGKTWNHPAVWQGKLYVRNAEEMACYDLSD